MIKKKEFVRYKLDEEKAKEKGLIFTIRLNEEEAKRFYDDKIRLNQPKDSTAFKQLARIGSNVIHSQLCDSIIRCIFKNKRRNKRTGLEQIE